MGYYIAAAALLFFALLFWLVGVFLQRSTQTFDRNQRFGRAEVVGYDRGEQSSHYSLLVRILDLDDGKLYNCKSQHLDLAKYPKGAVVDVVYAPKRVMGIDVVEVHLADAPPMNGAKFAAGLKIFALVLLIISGILVLAGIVIPKIK